MSAPNSLNPPPSPFIKGGHRGDLQKEMCKRIATVFIKLLTKDDAELLGEFFTSLSEKTVYFFHPHKMTYENGREQAEKIGRGEIRIFGAFLEDDPEKLAGYVFATNEPVAKLGFCVRDECQGKGIGQELLKHVIDFCRAEGRKGISLEVFKDNPRAIHVYEKSGFKICGETDDKVQHRMLLELQL